MYMQYINNSPLYQHQVGYRKCLKIGLFCLSETLLLSWLIYGNVLYYSDDAKGCGGDSILPLIWFIIILLGYLQFFVYFMVVLVFVMVCVFRMR